MQATIIPSVPIRPPGALAGTLTIPITNCEETWRWVESGQKDGSICEWMVLEEGEVWAFGGGERERMENKREDGFNGGGNGRWEIDLIWCGRWRCHGAVTQFKAGGLKRTFISEHTWGRKWAGEGRDDNVITIRKRRRRMKVGLINRGPQFNDTSPLWALWPFD